MLPGNIQAAKLEKLIIIIVITFVPRVMFVKKAKHFPFLFVWFDSLRPLNNLSVMRDGSSWVEPVLS